VYTQKQTQLLFVLVVLAAYPHSSSRKPKNQLVGDYEGEREGGRPGGKEESVLCGSDAK
jgi:hypothetical protein